MKIWKFIILLTFLGFCLRITNLHSYIFHEYGYDQARDFLVSRHFLKYNEFINRGPEAFGAANLLTNSVGYFYLTTALLSISQNPEIMMLVVVYIFCLMIPMAYLLGKVF